MNQVIWRSLNRNNLSKYSFQSVDKEKSQMTLMSINCEHYGNFLRESALSKHHKSYRSFGVKLTEDEENKIIGTNPGKGSNSTGTKKKKNTMV